MKNKPTRRQGREWALQLLFQLDLNPGDDFATAFDGFWNQQWISNADTTRDTTGEKLPPPLSLDAAANDVAPPASRAFVERLVKGVLENRTLLDDTLQRYTHNWNVQRMGVVDRNVLRLALFEILIVREAPPPVIINEAIDLAKYYSNADSGRFVNGILDRAIKDSNSAPEPNSN